MNSEPGIAWITGGGTGIGRALALRLARAGWQVAVSGRRREPLEEVEQAARDLPGSVLAVPADVTDSNSVAAAVTQIHDRLGEVNLAVMNAGMFQPLKARNFNTATFQAHFDVNVLGAVRGIEAVLPGMREHGGQIVLVSSVAGYRGLPTAGPYGASKAALINLAETLHMELARYGIRVSVVNPGFVETPLTEQNQFPMPAITTPEVAAERMYQGIRKGRFETTFPRRFTWLLKVLRCLPYALYFPLIKKATLK